MKSRIWMSLVLLLYARGTYADSLGVVVQYSGNGNYYGVVSTPGGIDWRDARANATHITYKGISAQLASITSENEQAFISQNLPISSSRWWIGGFQVTDALGRAPLSTPWNWTDGSTWGYTNWASGEPNSQGDETCLMMRGNGQWDDLAPWNGRADIDAGTQVAGYLVEFVGTKAPQDDNLGVYRPTTGQWLIRDKNGSAEVYQFGYPGHDLPVPADYTGTGHDMVSVYRLDTGQWFLRKDDGSVAVVSFGWPGHDLPVPRDYLGLGFAQIAVYRLQTGEWFILNQFTGNLYYAQWGWGGVDLPLPLNWPR